MWIRDSPPDTGLAVGVGRPPSRPRTGDRCEEGLPEECCVRDGAGGARGGDGRDGRTGRRRAGGAARDGRGQFRHYGDVALALRTDVALNLRSDPIPFPHTLYWVSTGYGWRKVIYAKRAQEAAARALIDGFARELERHGRTKDPGAPNDIISITMCWWYASLVPLIKHSAFAQEREVRLVRIATGGFTEPSHRVSYLGIVPYVPLERVAEKDDDHRLPLIGAHLGPIHHPEPAELGLRSLL